MIRSMTLSIACLCLLAASLSPAQQKQAAASASNRVVLGQFTSGASVSFARSGSGKWGIEVSGKASPWMMQQNPAQIETFRPSRRRESFL